VRVVSNQRLATRRTAIVGVVAEIVVNFVLPYAIFSYYQPTLGDVKALIASSVPPILWSLFELVRKRRVDAISLMVIAGIVLGLLAFLGGGSVKFLQLRENLVTAIIGLLFLGSVAVKRPIIYEFARAGEARQSPERAAAFEALRDRPGFRQTMVTMTVVWGVGMLLLTAIACVLVYALSIRSYLIVGPIVGNAGFGLLALWTFLYASRRRRLALRNAPTGKLPAG
jgi:hypothetical protein